MAKATPRVLIANRGEIASRILRTARRLGFFIITVYTTEDASAPHSLDADLSCPVSSYTSINEIIQLIQHHKIEYVIPGYGFLSENESFAAAVNSAGAVFVGPDPSHISAFGIKDRARDMAARIGVPICPGSGVIGSEDEGAVEALKIGYPVMLKATAGGGGMGLQICQDETQLRSAFSNVVSRGKTLFSNPDVFLERYYPVSRHIEVQIFGNGQGDCVTFGERECSIQRRHQKVIEESPSPFVDARPGLRERLSHSSQLLGSSIKYQSAGTVEYLVDDATGDFFFLEMNTRLQVEHGITELRFDIDLVELMLLQAKSPLDLTPFQFMKPKGAAIEARVYAENALKDFIPSPGVLQHVEFGQGSGVRVDTWVRTGINVSLSYDPLLAKVMGYGETRTEALASIAGALTTTKLQGIVSNIGFLTQILESPRFARGETTTNFLADFNYKPSVMEILSPGSYTTIQDFPARSGIGYGIPVSGPADSLNARLANIIVGNKAGCELLEVCMDGPSIRFHVGSIVALAGAAVDVNIDGVSVGLFRRLEVSAGSVLTIGRLSSGCRTYLAILGGLPMIPQYLGSKATSPVANIGGLQGRPLVAGDVLDIEQVRCFNEFELPHELVPKWDTGTIYCMSGPHDSPDIITPESLKRIYEGTWTVSHQASRVGVRLHGPQPQWARETGGDGGSHPSNYLDYAYCIGALVWTGDSAVIFPADSPSLGGFITSSVIPHAEMFKVGQLAPGDKFRFVQISLSQALELREAQEQFLESVEQLASGSTFAVKPLTMSLRIEQVPPAESTSILFENDAIAIRQGGDSYIIVEYDQTLDLQVRCKVQALFEAITKSGVKGVRLATPMACSLLIEYDCFELPQSDLVSLIKSLVSSDGPNETLPTKLSSRIIKLPIVFDDKVNKNSIERYIATQRSTASYLPDPIEFIARSNGLKSKNDVLEKILSTNILVLGVGFFTGTPIGMPLDPRAQLVVPKFNPPRIFSPAGGLGIGGVFFSVDPIEAPGGYVNFGRTLPGWDVYALNKSFGQKPWLFRNFDQLSFFAVEEEEFDHIYAQFQAGKFDFDITETEFNVNEYSEFCKSVWDETVSFKAKQQEATKTEIEREKYLFACWQREQEMTSSKDAAPPLDDIDESLKIKAGMHASVFKIKKVKESMIEKGDTLIILEAMKMEVNIFASAEHIGKKVHSILVAPGDIVKPGDTLITLSAERDTL